MTSIEKAIELKNCANNEGLVFTAYLPSYDFSTSAKGVQSIVGNLEMHGKVPFRVWGSSALYDKMKASKYQGIYDFEGKANEYNGSLSIIITDIKNERKDLEIKDFVETPYNGEVFWKEMAKYMKMLSKPAFEVYKRIMTSTTYFSDKTAKEEFLYSTAAVSHHDAFISGLIAHTYKVAHNVVELTKNYPNILAKVNMDVLIMGALLHDIGKIVEYEGLGMSETGKLCSHLSLGIEVICKHRDFIIEKMGEDAYYRLQAVITQHHGQYGDRPRTMEAWIVHKADDIESKFEALEESLEMNEQGMVFDTDYNYKLN